MIKELMNEQDTGICITEVREEDAIDRIPTMEINRKTGVVTVNDLLIDVDKQTYITAQFRGLRGSDDEFMNKMMSDRAGGADGSSDWKLLSRVCTQWGDSDSLTSGELLTSAMPWGTLAWLRANVISGHYFRIPGNT